MQKLLAIKKALVPLVAYVISEVANKGFDLNTPSGEKAAISAVVVAIFVYFTKNKEFTAND